MTESNEKNVVETNLTVGVYTIYDTVLKQFEPPFTINQPKLSDYLTILANDCQSKYYGHEDDYIINKIGDFNQTTGEIESHFIERISVLSQYINQRKRDLQTCLITMNYLPTGYFKMPEEMKKDIQDKINESVKSYVENFVVPDLDLEKTGNTAFS